MMTQMTVVKAATPRDWPMTLKVVFPVFPSKMLAKLERVNSPLALVKAYQKMRRIGMMMNKTRNTPYGML